MNGNPITLTRRHFSQLLAATAASTLFTQNTFASAPAPNGFAYIASTEDSGTLHTFKASNSRWRRIQSIPSAFPAHLEPHRSLPVLYAVHNVPLWDHLPRGAVSAYTITPQGQLTHLNTQPLSLAATHPRHAAVSPDGTCLAVLSPGTGIYNILPLARDGALQAPRIIRKQLNLPQIHSILFHSDSKTLLNIGRNRQPVHRFLIEDDSLVHTATDTGPLPNPAAPPPPSIIALVSSPTSFVIRPA